MSDIERRLTLRSIRLDSMLPDAGQADGTVHYSVVFDLTWDKVAATFDIKVSTREGWETARHLACEQVKQLAQWLGAEAEHQKSGPHIQKLY